MKILALETSGEYCSAALWLDGRSLQRHVPAPASHTGQLLPQCASLLAEAGFTLSALDGIAFGCGPGAFTGVRVAASAAQGLALAHQLPLVPISSLAALARSGWRATGLSDQLPILDARRHEVYWAGYRVEAAAAELLCAEQVSAVAAVNWPHGVSWGLVGRGVELLGEDGISRLQPAAVAPASCAFAQAQDVAALAAPRFDAGAGLAPEAALPVYLRSAV